MSGGRIEGKQVKIGGGGDWDQRDPSISRNTINPKFFSATEEFVWNTLKLLKRVNDDCIHHLYRFPFQSLIDVHKIYDKYSKQR